MVSKTYIYIYKKPSTFHGVPEKIPLKTYKIFELFDIETKRGVEKKELKEGHYPLIEQSAKNNGVGMYCDKWVFDGDYISVCSNGEGAGTCFVQHGKFAIKNNNPPSILKLKDEYNYSLEQLAYIMTLAFSPKYDRSNTIRRDTLSIETITIPENGDYLNAYIYDML